MGATRSYPSAAPARRMRIENTGLVKRDGCYYVNGQNAGLDRAFQKRVLLTLVSYNFEHWTDAGVLGVRRDDVPPRPVVLNYQVGPQVHLGAGLWDRGNVILGFYGQWNAPLHSDDRRDMRMDIGLVVSSDALHYYEPIPEGQTTHFTSWITVGRRSIGRVVSRDFRHFSKPEIVVGTGADMLPSHVFYTNAKTALPGCPDNHVMFPWVWELENDGGAVWLLSSPDGWTWSRVPGGPILSPGRWGEPVPFPPIRPSDPV